jgi:hypothetical protein
MVRRWCSIAQAALPLAVCQCSVSTQCSSYLQTTIAEMRRANGSGCFELAHVVVVARTPSAKTPRVYVQDPAGGPYTAIRAKCDASPTHACPSQTASGVQALIDGAQVTLRGYYLQGSLSGFEELYLDDVQDEQRLALVPSSPTLGLEALARDAHSAANWFQLVTAQVPAEDPLVMYDFSPRELRRIDGCPAQSGFGVIPRSAAPGQGVLGCTGTSNPEPVSEPSASEVLIGREFFKEFFASTDCACAAQSKQHLLDASGALSGPIRGLLIPEIAPGTSALYQVFHPTSKSDFAISGG